jgi:hypothetical protein
MSSRGFDRTSVRSSDTAHARSPGPRAIASPGAVPARSDHHRGALDVVLRAQQAGPAGQDADVELARRTRRDGEADRDVAVVAQHDEVGVTAGVNGEFPAAAGWTASLIRTTSAARLPWIARDREPAVAPA